MRRLLALASVTVVLTLAACAPEGSGESPEELSPTNSSTYAAEGAPSIEEIDLDVWASGFLPSVDSSLKTEVLHAGETESADYASDGALALQLACAADTATSLTVSIDTGAGEAETSQVACAPGVSAAPTVTELRAGGSATVSLTASVDTAIAIQIAP